MDVWAQIPAGVRAGDTFFVEFDNGIHAAVCPFGFYPGDEVSLQLDVPDARQVLGNEQHAEWCGCRKCQSQFFGVGVTQSRHEWVPKLTEDAWQQHRQEREAEWEKRAAAAFMSAASNVNAAPPVGSTHAEASELNQRDETRDAPTPDAAAAHVDADLGRHQYEPAPGRAERGGGERNRAGASAVCADLGSPSEAQHTRDAADRMEHAQAQSPATEAGTDGGTAAAAEAAQAAQARADTYAQSRAGKRAAKARAKEAAAAAATARGGTSTDRAHQQRISDIIS
jgi:hypothetical protein